MKRSTKSLIAALAAVALLLGFATAATAQDPDAPSIVEIANADSDFTTLSAALALSGLEGQFLDCGEGEGPFTVLAPNEDAFSTTLAELGLEVGDLAADPELIATLVSYHVIDGAVTSDVVAGLDGASAPTLQGEEITVAVDGDTISLLSGNPTPVNVISADVGACNGVIHVIDGVLVPPTVAEALGVAAQGDEAAEEEPAEDEPADEEPAEELANTGANSAMVAVIAAALLAGGLMTVAAVRPARRRS